MPSSEVASPPPSEPPSTKRSPVQTAQVKAEYGVLLVLGTVTAVHVRPSGEVITVPV
ncbi:MAG: hypothetical protein ACR2M4_13060 [Actinomycetota bacterium]